MVKLTPIKSALFLGAFLSFTGGTLYAVIIYPMQNVEKYKKIQEINRAGINQEEIQPGGMRVWSDPFAKRKTS